MSSNGVMHEEVPITALVPQAQTIDALAIQRAPNLVLSEATRAAKALSKVIEGKQKKVVFNGKTYLQFEDWQTLGRFYGVTAVARSTKYVEYGDGDYTVRGFEAVADALLVGTNQVISSAEAMCLNDEGNWSNKPLFQLKSMAQTRACAKALRNVLAWVVVLAGYAPTPAEEMEIENGNGNGAVVAPPRRKSEIAPEGVQTISIAQQKRMFAIAKDAGKSNEQVREVLGRHGFEHSHEIRRSIYDEICNELKG
jgi:hypothetical protein